MLRKAYEMRWSADYDFEAIDFSIVSGAIDDCAAFLLELKDAKLDNAP